MSKTWKELKAEGVRRCRASFKGGGRCRRRVADQSAVYPDARGSYCTKHAPFMDRVNRDTMRAIELAKRGRTTT